MRYSISCILPQRTFWEKAALLHEQHTHPKPVEPANRQSRHLYDLHQLWTVGNLMASITHQDPMFRKVMAHRKTSSHMAGSTIWSFRPAI